MGYSTTLYSVDLNKLRAACGSKDSAIVEAVLAADAERTGGKKPVDWTKGPFICVTWQSELGRPGSVASVSAWNGPIRPRRSMPPRAIA